MDPAINEVAIYGFAMAAAVHGAFGLYALRAGRLRVTEPRSRRAFTAALLATAGWSLAMLLWNARPSEGLDLLASGLDLVRYGLWFSFLLALFGDDFWADGPRTLQRLRVAAISLVAVAAGVLVAGAVQGGEASLTRVAAGVGIALPLCGLLIVEQLFRNLSDDSRWNAKPMCLGLACVFVFDIYCYTQALLYGRLDPDAQSARGVVHTLAVPFLYVAFRRTDDWLTQVQVSRTAAFYSATMILAGLYLLFMAGIGYYVRHFGGQWGAALQLGLLAGGLTLLGMLMISGSLRSWLRVFVGKHFYSYRYDYREEWLRFTAMLSTKRSPHEVGESIVRGLAKMVECPGGILWTRAGSDAEFVPAACWNMPRPGATEATNSPLCTFLRDRGWVVDLDEYKSTPRRYETLSLPNWLLDTPNGWLVVPLLAGDDLLGFVLLSRPLTAIKLNWEVRDLLKTAARQAAGYVAQMQATEALLEARKFEAFNRMSAFVVHDLKNIVAQLSLMLKNAERLHDNREFQQDMLLTVESSLEKMRRLMLQLREGATPPGGSRGVELTPIVRRLSAMAASQGRALQVAASDRLFTRGHDDRLERVLGHLVQNALDATPPEGRVWIGVQRYSGQVRVEVGDTGVGMSEEFVRNQLFRPFNTTKHSGMGIGTYESFQYIRELGGSVSVQSQPGQGSTLTVLLPLFEVHSGSDLVSSNTP
jgi:putative PEP-CTERM system histidine kinase